MRIMIFGRPGSGKSTFAAKVAHQAKLPLYHLDKYFYTHHWQECDPEKFMIFQENLVDQEQWVIDGNSIRSLQTRYRRADIVLYFNFPRFLCLCRLFKRRFWKDTIIEDRAQNCLEVVRWCLIRYMWQFEKRVAESLNHLHSCYPHTPFFIIKSDKQAEEAMKIIMLKTQAP